MNINYSHYDKDLLINESFIKFFFSIESDKEEYIKFTVFDPIFNIEFIPGTYESTFSPGINYWVGFDVDSKHSDEKPTVKAGFRLLATGESGETLLDITVKNEDKMESLLPKILWIVGDSNAWATFGNDDFRYTDIGGFHPTRTSIISLSLNRFLLSDYLSFFDLLPISKRDCVALYLGEIDMRYSIHRHCSEKSVGIEDTSRSLAVRYKNAISEISSHIGCRIIVLSPNPPIRESEWLDPAHSPILGTPEERKIAFDTFNSEMAKGDFEYLDWTEEYSDGEGFIFTEMLFPNNHHIRRHEFIKKSLEEKIKDR